MIFHTESFSVPCAWTYLRPLFCRLPRPRGSQQAGGEACSVELTTTTIAGNSHARDFAISFPVSTLHVSTLIFRNLFPFYKRKHSDSKSEAFARVWAPLRWWHCPPNPGRPDCTHSALTDSLLLPLWPKPLCGKLLRCPGTLPVTPPGTLFQRTRGPNSDAQITCVCVCVNLFQIQSKK